MCVLFTMKIALSQANTSGDKINKNCADIYKKKKKRVRRKVVDFGCVNL